MLKKILIILSCILFLSQGIYATNHSEENESEKLYVDIGGWCPGIPVEFEIYDLKEWDNRTQIEDDEDINFTVFQNVDVNIHSGPFESMETLFSQEIDERTFSYTFEETGNYLMTLDNNNQDYEEFQTYVEIIPCRGQNIQSQEEDEEKIFEFPQDNIIIELENNSNQNQQVNLETIRESSYQQYPQLDNVEKMFEITLSQDDETQIITTIQNINSDISELLYFNEQSETWDNIDFQDNNQEIIFESTQAGIFALTSENQEVEEVITQEDTNSSLSNNQSQENTTQDTDIIPNDLESTSQENSTSDNNSIILIIIGIIVLVGIIILVITNKKKNSGHIYNTPKDEEILTSYNQEYERTKSYVKQYKESYPAQQIKTALIQANIHEDIINKVFLEENVKVHNNVEQ